MNKRGAGVVLIAVSAFLIGVRSINGTAYTVGQTYLPSDQLDNQIAMSPTRSFAFVSGIVGVVYLLWAEVEETIAARRK